MDNLSHEIKDNEFTVILVKYKIMFDTVTNDWIINVGFNKILMIYLFTHLKL